MVPERCAVSFSAAVAALDPAVSPYSQQLVAEAFDDPTRAQTDRSAVAVAARLLALCEMPWSDDKALIGRRLDDAKQTSRRVCLTVDEEAAYNRVRDRLVRAWHGNDPLARSSY